MKTLKKLMLATSVAAILPVHAMALDSYPAELVSSFTGWCTGEGYTAQICSCAVTKAPMEIPAAAMASYLAAAEGQGTATVSAGVGATAMQIVTTGAATSSGGSADTMKSLGGLLGN